MALRAFAVALRTSPSLSREDADKDGIAERAPRPIFSKAARAFRRTFLSLSSVDLASSVTAKTASDPRLFREVAAKRRIADLGLLKAAFKAVTSSLVGGPSASRTRPAAWQTSSWSSPSAATTAGFARLAA